MKKHILGAAALCAVAAAHADVAGFAGLGITGGGDKLATVEYTNGDTQNINSGGLVEFRGGAEYRAPNQPWAVQASIGYHVDRTAARNGDITFSRWPIELIGLWSAAPNVRLGAGLRYATNARLSSSGASYIGNYDMSASTGAIVEAEYLFTPHMGLAARYVSERYKFDNGVSVDGNHVGVHFSYYFF